MSFVAGLSRGRLQTRSSRPGDCKEGNEQGVMKFVKRDKCILFDFCNTQLLRNLRQLIYLTKLDTLSS